MITLFRFFRIRRSYIGILGRGNAFGGMLEYRSTGIMTTGPLN